MAKQLHVELIDDIDSSPAAETVRWGLDGVAYEIDLNDDHAAELRGLLDPWIRSGRRVRRSAVTASAGRLSTPVDYDPAAVRAWAASNGVQVSTRGRISAAVVEQYRAAGY
jgi:hypothetical protein